MTRPLRAEHRKRRRHAVENAFDVDINGVLPFIDPKFIKRGDWPNTGVADKNIQPTKSLAGQANELG